MLVYEMTEYHLTGIKISNTVALPHLAVFRVYRVEDGLSLIQW